MNTRLGGRVIGLPELPFLPVNGTNINDATPLPLDHTFNNLLGDIKQAIQIGVHDSVPIIV